MMSEFLPGRFDFKLTVCCACWLPANGALKKIRTVISSISDTFLKKQEQVSAVSANYKWPTKYKKKKTWYCVIALR